MLRDSGDDGKEITRDCRGNDDIFTVMLLPLLLLHQAPAAEKESVSNCFQILRVSIRISGAD